MSSTHRPTGSLVGAESDTENRGMGSRSQIFTVEMFLHQNQLEI